MQVKTSRAPFTNANTPVGFLLVLLLAALVLYRTGAVAPATNSRLTPPQMWRIPLGAEVTDVAGAGPFTLLLAKDRLGSPALMVLDSQGRLVRIEPLGSPGRFELLSSPLGGLCLARDQGALALYGADGKRRWTVHLPGPITALTADDAGIAVAFGAPPGSPPGDGFAIVSPAGQTGKPIYLSYAAITALARGPGHATVAAVFAADPTQAAEALLFFQPDGKVFSVPAKGTGSARLAAGAEAFFVGTAHELTAYDGSGNRRWTVRRRGIKCLVAGPGAVVIADGGSMVAYSAADGKLLWQRTAGRPISALTANTDGIVAAIGGALEAFAWDGTPRWALPETGDTWDLNGDAVVVIEKETVAVYRTH